jgi:TolB-like protein/tetratricopeptide (TPR) repeat protein/tRNA A-37 threonylcarbamoyl transferase component Bud32
LQPGSRLGPYEIVGLIGAGGMGQVYRARDPRLGREVAIKVLPDEMQRDPERLRRFDQEARSVAALSHPNVLAIYDVGTGDTPYLVTELLDGETLRDQLNRGPLPVRRVIDVGGQIVAGIAAAHARSIVHRDLKPENVFLTTSGVVKILDFGLAKVAPPIDADATRGGVTGDGTLVGTIGYMAPEQVRGLASDHRADIFAIGAIFHEMVSGARAFHGDTPADTLSAILTTEPPSLVSSAPGTPAPFARLVSRCLAKHPRDRFESARDVEFALGSLADAAPAGASANTDEPSIAVLPFTNMSVEPDTEYFSDGLAEELINALARLRGLRVAARTSAFQFRGRSTDVREIGRQLNVEHVLEGSVRRAGRRLRVTVQLINVADGYHVWSERYDREMADVFEIQDDITQAVVKTLEPALLGHQSLVVRRHSDNVQAFELYLKGRHLWHQRTPQSLRAGITQFDAAIALDPDYALAHAGLADSYAILSVYGFVSVGEARAKAEPAAIRAMALDAQLAESHFAMALFAYYLTGNWTDAERHFRETLRIQPRSSMAQAYFGLFLSSCHRFDESASRVAEATALEPLAPFAHAVGALSMYVAGRHEQAVALGERALTLHPDFALGLWAVGVASGKLGRFDRAIGALERIVSISGRAPVFLSLLGLTYARAGRRSDALALVDELETRAASEFVSPAERMTICVGLGDPGEIYASLEVCLRDGIVGPRIENFVGPYLDELASDARIGPLLNRLRLVPRTV